MRIFSVFHTLNLKYRVFFFIQIKLCFFILDNGSQLYPLIQSVMNRCFIFSNSKFPEIGKGVSRIGKILTAMRPAHRIIGHSVGRPDIE